MTSNPTTPLTSRKIIYGSSGNLSSVLEASTKIPILTRNGSLRMRNSKSFSNDHQQSPKLSSSFTTASTLPCTIRENSKSSSFLDQHQDLYRTPLDFLAAPSGVGTAKMQNSNHTTAGGGLENTGNCIPNGNIKKLNNNNLAKHDRSMVSYTRANRLKHYVWFTIMLQFSVVYVM